MRRRNLDESSASSPLSHSPPPTPSPFSSKRLLKTIDIFPKLEREYTAPLSSKSQNFFYFTSVLLMLLVMNELLTSTFLFPSHVEKQTVVVNKRLRDRLRINLNITFHGLDCRDLHLDAMDVAGENQVDLEDTFVKTRLDKLSGKVLGDGGDSVVNGGGSKIRGDPSMPKNTVEAVDPSIADPSYCGDCYGAEKVQGDCCNTCKQLMDAYVLKSWSTRELYETSAQCVREKNAGVLRPVTEPSNSLGGVFGGGKDSPASLFTSPTNPEACNLNGYLLVNSVSGNFHIALGTAVVRDGRHVHQFIPSETRLYNSSHTINHLSFGPPLKGSNSNYKGLKKGPLDGRVRTLKAETGTGLFQYFLKVVPEVDFKAQAEKGRLKDFDLNWESNTGTGNKKNNGDDRVSPKAKIIATSKYPNLQTTNKDLVLTNSYSHTEKYKPLLMTLTPEHHQLGDSHLTGLAGAVPMSSGSLHNTNAKHAFAGENSGQAEIAGVLPGVFFVYEVNGFAIHHGSLASLSRDTDDEGVDSGGGEGGGFFHLVIRIMALIGGVVKVMEWIESYFTNPSVLEKLVFLVQGTAKVLWGAKGLGGNSRERRVNMTEKATWEGGSNTNDYGENGGGVSLRGY